MTQTVQFIGPEPSSPLGQIVAALVAGVLIVLPILFLWIKAKMNERLALAEAEALEAQNRLARAKREAEESKALAETAVRGVEKITNDLVLRGKLSPAEAKKSKSEVTALAHDAGVDKALESMVDRLGFARSKSKPSVQAPKAED